MGSAAARSRAGIGGGIVAVLDQLDGKLTDRVLRMLEVADQDFSWQTFPAIEAFDQGQENALRLFIIKGDAHRIK